MGKNIWSVIALLIRRPLLKYIATGDVIYSRLLGKDIIILNSEKSAKELLENRSKNYSDRPFIVTNELLGFLCFFVASQSHPAVTLGVE